MWLRKYPHILDQVVEPGYSTATSSSTYLNFAAFRAVDGNLSQSTMFCSHTDFKSEITEVWLLVGLRKILKIAMVKYGTEMTVSKN